MLLLTEGTLFFLNLAHSTRTRDRQASLRAVVQSWIDGVVSATASTPMANSAPHATRANTNSAFESAFRNGLTISKTSECRAKGSSGCSGCARANLDHTHDQVSFSLSNSDSVRCVCFLDASLFQWQMEPGIAIKRRLVECTAAKDSQSHTRPSKRVKFEDRPPSVPCRAHPHLLQRHQKNKEDRALESMQCPEFTHSDLPVPCDQRWSHLFLSTAILWYGVQKDVWSVPEEEFTAALQHIFDVVYPGSNHKITPAGSVFKLALRRINEWRSSFGSSALAMMLHFFSSFDNNSDIVAAAEFLSTDHRFLHEDPDSAEPTNIFRSPFLLSLIATTHLRDIDAFVDVPGWDTRAMAAGSSGEGVIALAAVALERALRFIGDGTLNVDRALGEIPVPSTISSSTHSKTMSTDMLIAHDAPAASHFSSANWSGPTAMYQESARKRGAMFVSETFAAAQARRRRMCGGIDIELGANASLSGILD